MRALHAERQESYSNKIINVMPGILVTADYQLKVIHMNQAARDLFDPLHKKELIGAPVSDLMDDYSLVNLISFDKNRSDDQIYLEDRKDLSGADSGQRPEKSADSLCHEGHHPGNGGKAADPESPEQRGRHG